MCIIDHYYMNHAGNDRKFFVYLGQFTSFPSRLDFLLHWSLHLASSLSTPRTFAVYTVVILELLHVVFLSHTTYSRFASGFGNVAGLSRSEWSGAALPAVSGAGELLAITLAAHSMTSYL